MMLAIGPFKLIVTPRMLLLYSGGPLIVTVLRFLYKNIFLKWCDLHMAQGRLSNQTFDQIDLANLLFMLELQWRVQEIALNLLCLVVYRGIACTSTTTDQRSAGALLPDDYKVIVPLAYMLSLFSQSDQMAACLLLYKATSPDLGSGAVHDSESAAGILGLPKLGKLQACNNRVVMRKAAGSFQVVDGNMLFREFDNINFN